MDRGDHDFGSDRTVLPGLTTLDEFSFHQRLAQTPGVALVVFTSAGCRSCRTWKRLLVDYHNHQRDTALFEVDAGHAQALAREFSVFHLPALFLYRDGRFHCALQSEAQLQRLADTIATALAAPSQEEP